MLVTLCLPHPPPSLRSALLCSALCQEAEPLASCWVCPMAGAGRQGLGMGGETQPQGSGTATWLLHSETTASAGQPPPPPPPPHRARAAAFTDSSSEFAPLAPQT